MPDVPDVPEVPDFEAMYAHNPDPFGVRHTWYERRKLKVLLATLLRERYGAGWDPACGTGDLTNALATRCEQVLATDASQQAVRITTALTHGKTNVHVRHLRLPDLPTTTLSYDLVIVAEVLYYLSEPDRTRMFQLLDTVTRNVPDAEVVAVHWRHHPHDAHLSGVDVTEELGAALIDHAWTPAVRHDDTDFVLASWVRPGDRDQDNNGAAGAFEPAQHPGPLPSGLPLCPPTTTGTTRAARGAPPDG